MLLIKVYTKNIYSIRGKSKKSKVEKLTGKIDFMNSY